MRYEIHNWIVLEAFEELLKRENFNSRNVAEELAVLDLNSLEEIEGNAFENKLNREYNHFINNEKGVCHAL